MPIPMRTIIVGCDDLATDLQNFVIDILLKQGYTVENINQSLHADLDYPQIAEAVCLQIIKSGYEKRAILMCGTGIGMAMTANKFKGIRAAVCHDIYSAERSILSNQSNVLCLGSRVIGLGLAQRIVEEWVSLECAQSSSAVKIEALTDIENHNLKDAPLPQSGCEENTRVRPTPHAK